MAAVAWGRRLPRRAADGRESCQRLLMPAGSCRGPPTAAEVGRWLAMPLQMSPSAHTVRLALLLFRLTFREGMAGEEDSRCESGVLPDALRALTLSTVLCRASAYTRALVRQGLMQDVLQERLEGLACADAPPERPELPTASEAPRPHRRQQTTESAAMTVAQMGLLALLSS